MCTGKLNITLEELLTITAVSRLLSWPEFWTYTLLLSRRDPRTLLTRINQDVLSATTGYSTRSIKRHLDKLRSLKLIDFWRGPEGANFYRFSLPLLDATVQVIREHLPDFGVEPRQRRKRVRAIENTVAYVSPADRVMVEQPLPADRGVTDMSNQSSVPREPSLDPEISALLDSLENKNARNTAVRFLTSLGLVKPR
ncbi:MAG: hypothetical protein FJY85_03885, partial [Deltaproteobacteria bacterium]|nr:hypothetical protein [Deltaproteobacteria bacterium]